MAAWINGLSSIVIDVSVLMRALSAMIDTDASQRLPSATSSSTLHFASDERTSKNEIVLILGLTIDYYSLWTNLF